MAHPKRRHSTSRRDKRRTHYKASPVNTTNCSNCGAAVLYHRVCPECGYYKGQPALEPKDKL